MHRAVHLLIALAALGALIVGGAVLLKHVAHLEHLLPAPNHHSERPTRSGEKPSPGRMPTRHRRQVFHTRPQPPAHTSFADSFMRRAPAYLGLVGWVGLLALGIAGATTVDRRLRKRLSRHYERYEIKLSMHDDAKPGDLDDMVEAIGAAVRKRYNDRVSDGQPYIAFELWHRPSRVGMQWTLCLVCEANIARTVEGIIAGAYPDVRVGREFDEQPNPLAAVLAEPRYVMRFRKRRPFIHPLGGPAPAATQRQAKSTPLIEAIAMTQTALAVPSLVRFQLTPASEQLEDRARQRLERHERRQQGHLHHDRHATSVLDQAELRSAVEIRHRGMFYLEVQVGSSDWETCNRIAASLVARRGENHLHRRYMIIRQRLYRQRFPSAYPPLLPPASMRNLVSGAELAHLLELPSARMKAVPVRRLTIPRMPAPPDAFRATDPHGPGAPVPTNPAPARSSR
jgi:hypothetical protein